MAEPSGSSVSFSGYGALKDYLTAQDLALCWGLGGLRGGGLARLSESRGLGRSDFAQTLLCCRAFCVCVCAQRGAWILGWTTWVQILALPLPGCTPVWVYFFPPVP